jgi:hypothetical protein
MPRVELSGKGDRIPEYAIPPFGSDGVIPPTVRTFTDSTDFSVQTYRDLGYTHFEVWCIGAAGGKGGGVQTGNTSDPSYAYGAIPSTSYGGEGGGGGLQKIGGMLADLPDVVPVVVGKEGAAGQDGNRHYRWRIASAWMYGAGGWGNYAVTKGNANVPGMTDASGNAIPPYFFVTDAETYPNASPAYLFYPEPSYVEPTDGNAGGASYFNDPPLAMASGGTGGKKSPVYSNSSSDTHRESFAMLHAPGGEGGQGGVGGQVEPGGGANGGTSTGLAFNDVAGTPNYRQEIPRVLTGAEDGYWDGIIGEGGGGGRGGTSQVNPQPPVGVTPPTVSPSSSGGKGSFSYADTSVFGPEGSVGTQEIIPGTAGGARVLKNNKYGSRSAGYNPNGVVIVRLTRIVD